MGKAGFNKAVLVNTNFSKANLEGAIFKEMGAVYSLAWSPDGKYLASGGEDALVRIWNTKTYEKVAFLKGHQDVIKCLCWSSDCSLLASGSHDKNIVIWDTLEWKLVTTLKGHHGEIECLIWNGKNYLISGDSDGNINMWNADKSWKIQHKISIKNKINRLRFLDSLNYLIVSSGEGIKILETDTYKEIFQLCNFNTIFDVDKKTNSLIYLDKYELEKIEWYWQFKEDYRIKELIRFNIENSYSEKIESWIYEHDYDDGDEYNTIYEIVDLAHSNNKNNFAILLGISHYDWDRGTDKTDLWDDRNLIFFNGKNKKILGYRLAFVIDYSIDGRYIASGETEAIRIFDADPESPKYGECIHTIKQLINCNRMNINNVYGLEDEQIKILKDSGAEGEIIAYRI